MKGFLLFFALGLAYLGAYGTQAPTIQDLQLNCIDPTYIVAGDFNGDAYPDLAVACHSCNAVATLRNLGHDGKECAAFGDAVYWKLNDSPVALAIGSFLDKPRGSDFPYTTVFPNMAVITQYLPGAGRLSPLATKAPFLDFTPGSIRLKAMPFITLTHLVLADFNDDGAMDVALLDGLAPSFSIYLGQREPIEPVMVPNGPLTGKQLCSVDLPGHRAYFMAAADFDRDGRMDLAVAVDGGVLVYHNAGDTFELVAQIPIGTKVTGLAIADFNRDGYEDIAAVDPEFGTLAIIMNKGCGKFELFTRIKKDGAPVFVAALDCNRDGLPDLAVAEKAKDRVEIVLTKLEGTTSTERPDPCAWGAADDVDKVSFIHSHVIPVGPGPVCLAIADFDLNGMPDIAVALHGADGTDEVGSPPEVQVIYNPCCCQGCGGETPCCSPEAAKGGGGEKKV